tara:strand:- start:1675 stop:2106 length:432 start_codon:yes stop_codon:yes gene_type:complete
MLYNCSNIKTNNNFYINKEKPMFSNRLNILFRFQTSDDMMGSPPEGDEYVTPAEGEPPVDGDMIGTPPDVTPYEGTPMGSPPEGDEYVTPAEGDDVSPDEDDEYVTPAEDDDWDDEDEDSDWDEDEDDFDMDDDDEDDDDQIT